MDYNTNNSNNASTEPAAPRKKIILWVEDDLMIGTILGNKLIAAGYDLIHVSGGEEALYQLKQVVPSLIVLDILLPGINGFDVLSKIKADSSLKDIPVIILSNVSRDSDIDKANAMGVKKFLVKPTTSLEEIIAEVKIWCK